MKKSFNIQELLHHKSKHHWNQADAPPPPLSAFRRDPELDLKHPHFGGSNRYKTNKQPCFIDRCWWVGKKRGGGRACIFLGYLKFHWFSVGNFSFILIEHYFFNYFFKVGFFTLPKCALIEWVTTEFTTTYQQFFSTQILCKKNCFPSREC